MRLTFTFIIFLYSYGGLFAQNTWNDFRSARGYFSFRYPNVWSVNEEATGNYRFAQQNAEKGVFKIVEQYHSEDSFDARKYLEREGNFRTGSSVRNINDNPALIFINTQLYDGKEMLQYVWMIGSGRVILQCTYTVRSDMKKDDRILAEYALVYQCIETIRFMTTASR